MLNKGAHVPGQDEIDIEFKMNEKKMQTEMTFKGGINIAGPKFHSSLYLNNMGLLNGFWKFKH